MACTAAPTSKFTQQAAPLQPLDASIDCACASGVGEMSAPPKAPMADQGVEPSVVFQVAPVSVQLRSTRLSLNFAPGPKNWLNESVAEVMVAPLGTGPPSDWKMANLTSVAVASSGMSAYSVFAASFWLAVPQQVMRVSRVPE